MTYRDFYKISHYLNEVSNNIFSNEDVACNAYEYMLEYELSYEYSEPTQDITILCIEIVKDMDYMDYEGQEYKLDIETMEKIFKEFLENH